MTMFEITSGITRKMSDLIRRLSQKVDTWLVRIQIFNLSNGWSWKFLLVNPPGAPGMRKLTTFPKQVTTGPIIDCRGNGHMPWTIIYVTIQYMVPVLNFWRVNCRRLAERYLFDPLWTKPVHLSSPDICQPCVLLLHNIPCHLLVLLSVQSGERPLHPRHGSAGALAAPIGQQPLLWDVQGLW